ncbi:phenylalanine--tRNA ligase subunit beta [Spirochaetota bacterium]
MPVVGIPVKQLKGLIGRDLSNDELTRCCMELGCDVEELAELNRIKCKSCGNIIEFSKTEEIPKSCDICLADLQSPGKDYDEIEPTEVIRLDLLADRPDNFDAAGLGRSIRGYLDLEKGLIDYDVASSEYTVNVDSAMNEPSSYRPFIVCAVIKSINFNDDSLKNIMKLQENLHWALGRDRKYASIGVYDLDKIKTQIIHYRAVGKSELMFAPLGSAGLDDKHKMTPDEILKKHPKGIDYAHLLEHLDKYPLLIDDEGVVLSMPPIINSEDTRVTIDTKNIFIDVTGLNEKSINRALNIIVTSVNEWDPQCSILQVNIKYPDREIITPNLRPDNFELNYNNTRSLIGVDLKDDEIIDCLQRMRYGVEKKDTQCIVNIPCYRTDILHEYDLIEDVAIAYGYKNIESKIIESFTIGNTIPKQEKKQNIRTILTGLGFFEVMNIMLTSEKRAYENLSMPLPKDIVIIDNPISTDQTIMRTELISGLLETLALNTRHELPQKIFEIGDIVLYDKKSETGTKENVVLAIAIIGSKMGFADIKSVVSTVIREIGLNWEVEAMDFPVYLNGRSGQILISNNEAGHIGEIHPEILENYHIFNPVVTAEINLSKARLI